MVRVTKLPDTDLGRRLNPKPSPPSPRVLIVHPYRVAAIRRFPVGSRCPANSAPQIRIEYLCIHQFHESNVLKRSSTVNPLFTFFSNALRPPSARWRSAVVASISPLAPCRPSARPGGPGRQRQDLSCSASLLPWLIHPTKPVRAEAPILDFELPPTVLQRPIRNFMRQL